MRRCEVVFLTFLSVFISLLSIQCSENEDNKNTNSLGQLLADDETTNEMPMADMEEETEKVSSVKTYLALGDSYTIGQGVLEEEGWPNQLAEQIESNSDFTVLTRIIAQTGWTTGVLKAAILDSDIAEDTTFNYVSLLIGVNDQFQNRSFSDFQSDFDELLTIAVRLAGGNKQNVFVLSIPDYGVTSFGSSGNAELIKEEIRRYNRFIENKCDERNFDFVNITDISNIMSDDQFTSDGLHPNGFVYSLWVDEVLDQLSDTFPIEVVEGE